MRVNGADMRRLEANFRFGDLPAGAVRGARGEEVFARVGVKLRAGIEAGGGIDFTGVMEKVNGFARVSDASLLLFLEGEKRPGSRFSESTSSYVEGTKGRLAVGLVAAMIGLPLSGELFAMKPEIVSARLWLAW